MADQPDYEREGALPPPIPAPEGTVGSHDWVIVDLRHHFPLAPGLLLAIEGMVARREYGLNKYGTVVWPGNGRPHLRDLLDETEDKVVYFRAAFDHDPLLKQFFWRDYIAELEFLLRLRHFLAQPSASTS